MNFNASVHEPSDVIVNSNLAFAVVFPIVATALCGVALFPLMLFKALRTQPYQWLVGNYLTCNLAIALCNGVYRAVVIQYYKDKGYVEAVEITDCGLLFFFIFPVAATNYCLFFLGLERFIFLHFKHVINWAILAVFVELPWAFGVYRYIYYLADADERYLKLPYLGICVDLTSEREARRIIHLVFDFILPFLLAVIVVTLASIKAYKRYREVLVKLTNGSDDERPQLVEEKDSIKKVFKDLLMMIMFVCLRAVMSIVVALLCREIGKVDRSSEEKDDFSTAATFFVLFEPCIVPVLYSVFNNDLRQLVCNCMLNNVSVSHNIEGEDI